MKIALFSSSNSAHFNGWFPCGLSLDRYRNPSRIRQFDVRGFQWRSKEKDRSSQCSTAKSSTRNPPFFPSPTQYQLFPGFLWFFQAGDDSEPNIPWSWRTQNQVHRVANTDLGLLYSSQAVASLAGSQRWRGGRARSFRSSQIILDPPLDKIETIFWRRTLITDDMKGDGADAHHTHFGRRSLLSAVSPSRIAPSWPQWLPAISFALIDPPRLHCCQISEKALFARWRMYLLDWI